MKKNKKRESGYHGYQEFNSVRDKIVSDYKDAKKKYGNRPAFTEHGSVSEELLINWLQDSLPQKYGVTSGYIIPDLYVETYSVYHFDIIVYDRFESPVLWVEPTEGNSKARAIPAKHVFAVYELKASLTPESVGSALDKLQSISQYAELFPNNFHTKAVFMELPKKHVEKKSAVLNKFLVSDSIYGFSGAYVFSTDQNTNVSASIQVDNDFDNYDPKEYVLDKKLLFKDVDKIEVEIYDTNKFRFYNPEPGYSFDLMSMNGEIAGIVKSYEQHFIQNKTRVFIQWSRNEFAVFFHELLSRLERGSFERYEMKFGLSFDEL
ncbi:DUF6602 domain-containing protein [Vibrio rotiferianus]|uniref:DUF6602 domain-containing protein n=1 Tax=Vibrio rotiferianus TaxID=190895 RepID=UPI00406A455E